MGIIQKAAEFIKKGQVKIIGQDLNKIIVQVNDKIVIWTRKPGRLLDSCSCENHAKFCNENPRCAHKIAVSCFLVMKGLKWE